MGKQGPCYHCGVTSTPLWRNGPPDKPVLCNACGSRWRTKGTLANYTPLHARAESNNYADHRFSRVKSITINYNKESNLLKRKPDFDNSDAGGFVPDYYPGYRKVLDDDISNRSSSGSAISNSESCAQFGGADASEFTGPAQSVVWDTTVPSKKRTCVNRPKQSPVEKLTKDLFTIWHEQQSSCFSGTSDEHLLFESETPMVSVEIGHGSVLIRHPSSIARDEESEASSLSVENKRYSVNEAYSHSVRTQDKNVNVRYFQIEEDTNPFVQGMQQEQLKRERSLEKVQVLGHHNSPLCNIDLTGVLNLEEFLRNLTNEEQQHLLKYLPALETDNLLNSLQNVFSSVQFKENICSYQKLLAEGVFDLTFLGAKPDDVQTLKRLTLSNFSKSRWVEHYNQFKKCMCSSEKSLRARGSNVTTINNVGDCKRSPDGLTPKIPEVKTMKSPKSVMMKPPGENKEPTERDDSCFSPKSFFALPSDGSSLLLDSFPFIDETSDQDLLLDMPSNGSFAQAELLRPTSRFRQQASAGSNSLYPYLLHP